MSSIHTLDDKKNCGFTGKYFIRLILINKNIELNGSDNVCTELTKNELLLVHTILMVTNNNILPYFSI